MTRSTNKDLEVTSPTQSRRSLRNRPPEEEGKKTVTPKGKKLIAKRKTDNSPTKNENKIEEQPLPSNEVANKEGVHTSNGESSSKLSSKPIRSGRKRPVQEIDEDKNIVEVEENGQVESSGKKKTKKRRKPPIKKKKEVLDQDEAEMWTPLEPLDGEDKQEQHDKPQSSNNRRKQALVARQAAAEVMLQKPLPRRRTNSDSSECQVVHSLCKPPGPKRIETVDIDDEASETGSIQIVAEPDVDSVFDFKRLLIQYRSVNLPSALWGVHRDPRDQFVSFTRFNPDYEDNNSMLIDRAVIFKGSLHPEVFIDTEKIELPEMFNVVETLVEAAQVVQFANNTVGPIDPNPTQQDT